MKTKIIIIILFCLIVGIFVSGCTSSIQNASVAGTYKSKDNTQTLVLNPDGTFLMPDNQNPNLRSGTYEIVDSGDSRYQGFNFCYQSQYSTNKNNCRLQFGEISGNKIYVTSMVEINPNYYDWIKVS